MGAGFAIHEWSAHERKDHPQKIETVTIDAKQRLQLDKTAEGSARSILDPASARIDHRKVEINDGDLVVSGREEQDSYGRGTHYAHRTLEFDGAPAATDAGSVGAFLNKHPRLERAETRLEDFYEEFTTSVVITGKTKGDARMAVEAPENYEPNALPDTFYGSPTANQANYIVSGFHGYPANRP